MTVLSSRPVARARAAAALDRAAASWFVVAAAGQWVFVYFIGAFYAGPTLGGRFEAWNRKELIKGYVNGDDAGNLQFAAHVLLAAVITASGTLQLVPYLRAHARWMHRWNGRLYALLAVGMALGGAWLVWIRGTYLTRAGAWSSTLLAALILTCAAQTLRTARARRMREHRAWALRLYLVGNGVWFQRIGYLVWIIVNRGPLGIGDHMDGPFDIAWGFGCFALPLATLETYLLVHGRGGNGAKAIMAAALFALAVATGVGIVGAYVFMWRPVL